MDFDQFTLEEIEEMIKSGKIDRREVVEFYNNEWWMDKN